MGVCLVMGGKSHYRGLCGFGTQGVKTTIVAYTSLRVKAQEFVGRPTTVSSLTFHSVWCLIDMYV